LPTSDSGTRRGVEIDFVDGERSEDSGWGVHERVDVPHEDGFGEGGTEMRESHELGTRGLSDSDSPNIRVGKFMGYSIRLLTWIEGCCVFERSLFDMCFRLVNWWVVSARQPRAEEAVETHLGTSLAPALLSSSNGEPKRLLEETWVL
jgi:hypothetical protein